jgi:hypothetical protein
MPGVGTTFLSQPATLVPGSVNDEGDMVTSFGFTQGAVWQTSGRVVMLPDLFPDSGTVCLDNAINAQRTVIGACITGNGTFYPVEWIGEGQPQVLTAIGVSLIGAEPIAIDNAGAISGSTVSSQAFVLMPDHRIRFLPQGFVASAVNDAGWTGGTVSGFGVVWTPADSLIDVAPGGQMLGINDANVAVGYESGGTCSGTSAIVWRQSVGARQLPCLAPAGTFEDDQAFAINDRNEVLGGALVFGANGQMTSYNVLWILPDE